jgi:hypothetical protein
MADNEVQVVAKDSKLVSVDTGEFAVILDTAKFEHLWRVATAFSKSDLVPDTFRNKPENCMLALQMAFRLRVDPMMVMQNTYVVKGRPGIEAKFAIALINSNGGFDGPLRFESDGDAKAKTLRCRAWAYRKGERVDGPWVTWAMVESEGWEKKDGSKWRSLPDLMIQYRAATFFGRLMCPEVLMGMQTVEEVEDVIAVDPKTVAVEKAKEVEARFSSDDTAKQDRRILPEQAGISESEAAAIREQERKEAEGFKLQGK